MAGFADVLGGVSPFSPEPPVTPEVLQRRRQALAAALAKDSQVQPHYTHMMQAIAQGLNAGIDGYLDRQAAQQQAAGAAAANTLFNKAPPVSGLGLSSPSNGGFGISGPTVIPAPAMPTTTSDATPVSSSLPSMAGGSGSDIGRYAKAIQSIESGGNYAILGPTTKSGDRAIGAYQVMGANVPEWTKAALGTPLTPAQFRADPAAQDAVFAHRFGSYVEKYGNPQDAASAWFTGRPLAQGASSKDVLGTSGSGYVDKFNRALARTASVDPQADMPAPGAQNAALDPNQGEVGFQIPPAPAPSSGTADPGMIDAPPDEFRNTMIPMLPQPNGGDMVPVPPSRPADLGGVGSGVSPQALAAALSNGPVAAPAPANDATIAALAPADQPAPNAALIQALDPSALGQSDVTDAAATFSPQLMGPPQSFDPGPAASPMAITVGPSPAPVEPVPQQVSPVPVQQPSPADIAQVAPPLPPPRPADLAQVDPRADMPSPGAQEAAISLPPQGSALPQGAGWARLPGPPLMVSNPAYVVDPNSNDAGAGAFARDPANRLPGGPVQVASNGPTVPVPPVAVGGPLPAVAQPPGVPAPAPTQAAQAQPGAPVDIRPPAQGGPAPAQAAISANGAIAANAAPQGAAPDLSAARQQWMAVMSHPFATKVQQDYARDQLKALDERGSFTQWKDDTGATWQRDQRTGQTSVVHDGVKYQTFKGKDDNTYAWNPENPTSAPVALGPTAGIRPLVDQQERAAVGVPKDYKGVVQVRPDGGIEFPGKASTEVNIDQKAETAEAQGRGTGLAKRLNDVADDGTKAAEDAQLYGRFADILGSVKTGKSTETLEKIRQMTGIALDPNTDNVQALNALIQYMGPRLRVAGSGSQSDRELGNFLQSIPSLAGTPEGNKKILDTLTGLSQYRKDRAAVATDWQTGEISAKEAFNRMNALPSPFAPKQQDSSGAGSAAPVTPPAPTPAPTMLKPGETRSMGNVTIRRVN